MNYGLAAAPIVQWLIRSDSQVYDAIRTFIAGAGQEHVDVAGPPAATDKAHYHGRAQVCPLPVVRLKMKMARHHLTGEPGVEVTCDETDMGELERWRREALQKVTGGPK